MSSIAAVPAVRRLDTVRSDSAAFEIVGHVSSADVENLFGLLEGVYALHDRVDLLIRLVDHDGVDWSDVDEDTIAEGKRLARLHVRRCAAVGEPNWLPYVQSFFNPETVVDLKHFASEDEAAAWEWLESAPAAES